MNRLSKSLILGEDTREGVARNKGIKISVDSCIWCDKPVWLSQYGYTQDHPTSDISVEKVIEKDSKALHKLCLLEIVELGVRTVNAMGANLKARGKL